MKNLEKYLACSWVTLNLSKLNFKHNIMKQQKRVLIISIICILISLGFTIYFNITPTKPKYEYHIILTNDSVFVFDRYNKQIGKYKPTNPKEQFDSILLLDNL